VKLYVALLRQVPEDLLPAAFAKPEPSVPEEGVSVRRIIWFTLSRPELLTGGQSQELARVFSLSEHAAEALQLSQAFVKLLREKHADALDAWLERAQASSVRELRQAGEKRIERDRVAVEAALSRARSATGKPKDR
jgi:hypothetical protein